VAGGEPRGGAVPVGAAKEPAAPANADAVSASCRVKPSKACRALSCYLHRACGAARAALCAANLAICKLKGARGITVTCDWLL
jgi:hypothetical protein